ncbi:MAG: hypothetical protein KF905_03955 [Flavobacteriales bacterium]|nr:hypothetical protein [Flavobacteriales bacterium]
MNERIDHTNYEAWLLDRLEGNLSPEQDRMLDAFLAANPGLDDAHMELPTLDRLSAQLAQADKEALKRTLPPAGMPAEPIDDFLIARLEGDLDARQLEALNIYLLHHPEHQRAERLYALTKLVPAAMAYADKQGLERQLPPTGMPDRLNLDDLLVARLEGELGPEQELALAAYLHANPDADRQWRLMQLARISTPPVVFPAKADLKKGGQVIAIGTVWATWAPRLRAAATVAVLLSIGFWAYVRTTPPEQQVAVVEQGTGQQDHSTPDPDTGTKGTTAPEVERAEALQPAPDHTAQQPPLAHAPSQKAVGTQQQEKRTEVMPPVQQPKEAQPLVAQQPNKLPDEKPTPDIRPAQPHAGNALAQHAPAPPESSLTADANGVPLGAFLAGKFRKRVLADDEQEARPLDASDALTALNKGMQALGGEDLGLSVERGENGRSSSFQLRLGRGLAITASR